MDQDPRQSEIPRRIQRRRLLLLTGLAFALVAWGPRAATVISDGWCSSCRALEQQRGIDAASRRVAALQREVDYARTAEGQDVEAKRRFGVGPDDELWITVDATEAEKRPEPQSVADRLDAWLGDAGARFVDHVCDVGAIFSYWVGIGQVDECVPVPVIEEEPPAEATDEVTASESAAQDAGSDGEAAGDETQR